MAPDVPEGAPAQTLRKLRIAFIIGSAEVGGAEHLVLTVLRSLPSNEFDCSVICPSGPLVARYSQVASRVATLGTVTGRNFLNPGVIVRMASLLRRWDVDVVDTSLYLSDVGGILAARLARVPRVVSHIHGHNFDVTEERGWPRVRHQCWSRIYRAIYALSDQLIAVSNAVKQDLIERRGIRVPAAKIAVVHHTLPPEETPAVPTTGSVEEVRALYGLDADAVVVSTIANLFPLKGHRYLLEALPIVVRSIPTLRCLIVGDGPSRTTLEALVDHLGLRDHVVFTGVLSDARRNAILECSRVIVLPSLSEGLGLVLLEAMAAVKPVVATDTGGVRELVIDRVSGVLVPPRDPGALAAAIVEVASDQPWAEQLGRAGRRRFDERFSRDEMTKRLRIVYAGGTPPSIE